jgi:hypothetical protein
MRAGRPAIAVRAGGTASGLPFAAVRNFTNFALIAHGSFTKSPRRAGMRQRSVGEDDVTLGKSRAMNVMLRMRGEDGMAGRA